MQPDGSQLTRSCRHFSLEYESTAPLAMSVAASGKRCSTRARCNKKSSCVASLERAHILYTLSVDTEKLFACRAVSRSFLQM